MPVHLAEEAAAELRARGLDVELRIIPGLAHSVDQRVIAAVEVFLAGVTAGSGTPPAKQ
jgi:predicted esterase